jgi:arsenite-transporting ATPase
MGGMMQDLAFAIPGVDEAMGFAEIMKSVLTSHSFINGIRHPQGIEAD